MIFLKRSSNSIDVNNDENDVDIKTYGITDPGMQRDSNEDSYLLMPEMGIYMVADGMGGHNAGEIASLAAIQTIKNHFTLELMLSVQNNKAKVEKELKNSILKAHKQIETISKTKNEYDGMGSTIAISLIRDRILHTCHVGDTRVYVSTPSGITQITNDHSPVAELVRIGEMTKEEARHSPLKNRITQAIGGPLQIVPEYNQTYALNPEDVVLICSDGLWEMLSDQEIWDIIMERENAEKTCKKLIQQANKAGGHDNITVVMVEIEQNHS